MVVWTPNTFYGRPTRWIIEDNIKETKLMIDFYESVKKEDERLLNEPVIERKWYEFWKPQLLDKFCIKLSIQFNEQKIKELFKELNDLEDDLARELRK